MLTYEPLNRREYHVAVSGGPDSMALLNMLVTGRKNVTAFIYDHGTENSSIGLSIVRKYCQSKGVNLIIGTIDNPQVPAGRSAEDYWRECRYKFFLDRNTEVEMLMGHHLDDQVENWIFTSLHGNPMLIPYRNNNYNVVRPFLTTRKADIVSYCERNNVPYFIDSSNLENKYKRNYIRNVLIQNALEVNPGLYTTIRNKVIKEIAQVQNGE